MFRSLSTVRRLVLLTAFFCTSIAATTARGDFVNYGDFSGNTVEFFNVTEISDDDLPLYGEPTVAGDALDFIAPGFFAQSQAGGIEFLNGRLRFTVEANDGFMIDSIRLEEFGSYFTFGDDSVAMVTATAFIQIGDSLQQETFTFETSGDSNGGWTEDLSIDFEPAHRVTFVMDNSLFALADEIGVAFIDKMGMRVHVETIAVPEPASVGLIGLGGLAWIRTGRQRGWARRRSRA